MLLSIYFCKALCWGYSSEQKQAKIPALLELTFIEGAYNLTKEALGISSSIEFCSIKLNKNIDPNSYMWW